MAGIFAGSAAWASPERMPERPEQHQPCSAQTPSKTLTIAP